jgi:hypothetical protein
MDEQKLKTLEELAPKVSHANLDLIDRLHSWEKRLQATNIKVPAGTCFHASGIKWWLLWGESISYRTSGTSREYRLLIRKEGGTSSAYALDRANPALIAEACKYLDDLLDAVIKNATDIVSAADKMK